MRFFVSGWVEKSDDRKFMAPPANFCGWMMKSWATSSRFTSCRPGLRLIFLSAEARARGLPQSSAPPASAIYSRLRLMAKRVSAVKRYATAQSA